jgi:hypothetical protein
VVYERILPLRIAGSVRRFQSRFLMADFQRALRHENATLSAVAPQALRENKMRFAALATATGFEFWRALRHDQGLKPADAAAAMQWAVLRLVGEGP